MTENSCKHISDGELDSFDKECMENLSKTILGKTVDIYKAMELAHEVHKDQHYGNDDYKFTYNFHLDSVSKVILNSFPVYYPHKSELLIGAWLHDSVEDQSDKITFEQIEEKFGKFVRDMIFDVTDPKDKDGNNLPRTERAKKLLARLNGKDYSLILKLSDKIANIEFCVMMLSMGKEEPMFEMYKQEYNLFKEALYNPNHDEYILGLWGYLDDLFENTKVYF